MNKKQKIGIIGLAVMIAAFVAFECSIRRAPSFSRICIRGIMLPLQS